MSIIHQFILGGHGRKNGRRRPGAVPIQTTVEKQISQKNTVHNMMALFIFMLFMALFITAFNTMKNMPTGEIFISGQTGSQVDLTLQGVSEKTLLSLVKDDINEGFWQLNLTSIKRNLESHAWVRQAEVRRQWPNQLFIGIDEYVPVARWNDHYLLTTTGNIVLPQSILPFSHLPMLKDQGLTATNNLSKANKIKDMISWFNFFQQPLILHGLTVTEQSRSAQGEMILVLNDAITLMLGADDIKLRFERLLALLETSFIHKLTVINKIDLRYSNGVAVSEHEQVIKSSMYIGQVAHQ